MLLLHMYAYGVPIVAIVVLAISTYEIWRDSKDPPYEEWTILGTLGHNVLCTVAVAVFWPLFAYMFASAGVEYVRPKNVQLRRLERAFQKRKSVY